MDSGSVLNKLICLSLNSAWQAIDVLTCRKAIEDMCSESIYGDPPKVGLDMTMDADGETLLYANPVSWERWITLPVRECDFAIKVGHGGEIRAPTVVLCANYAKIPTHTPSLCADSIFKRDKYKCQYCGHTFSRAELNLDHIIPESRGGPKSWPNIVTSCKRCNTLKDNRTPQEAGMRLLRKPTTPKAIPISFAFREAKHPSWTPFLHSYEKD